MTREWLLTKLQRIHSEAQAAREAAQDRYESIQTDLTSIAEMLRSTCPPDAREEDTAESYAGPSRADTPQVQRHSFTESYTYNLPPSLVPDTPQHQSEAESYTNYLPASLVPENALEPKEKLIYFKKQSS